MTTEYKLNTYIEWTEEDRAKRKCPVPDGADVTMWLAGGSAVRETSPQHWEWGECEVYITGYLIHSVPQEPHVRWVVVGGTRHDFVYEDKGAAIHIAGATGGRVVKLVEETE